MSWVSWRLAILRTWLEKSSWKNASLPSPPEAILAKAYSDSVPEHAGCQPRVHLYILLVDRGHQQLMPWQP